MAGERLQASQIQVGLPLPFDAYDAAGKLLLRKGYVIGSDSQLERLLEHGLFVRAQDGPPAHARAGGHERLSPQAHRVPVLELVRSVQEGLEKLVAEAAPADVQARVQALAGELQRGFKLDADAALAFVLVHHTGRYGPRRMVQTAVLSELLLSQVGVPDGERAQVLCAALTMNLSILELQDRLWSQARPTPEQEAQLRAHPQRGADALRALGVSDATWLDLVSEHHETIDGRGYPLGLAGAQIPRSAQLLSIADRYGAMATPRGYRPAALPNIVLKQIFLERDKSVDASLAGLLIKAIGIYPPGTFVALANGDTAVVVKRTQSANHPIVCTIRTAKREILQRPRKHNSSEPAYAITAVLAREKLDFPFDPTRLWDDGVELAN